VSVQADEGFDDDIMMSMEGRRGKRISKTTRSRAQNAKLHMNCHLTVLARARAWCLQPIQSVPPSASLRSAPAPS
jgi:hypothetical protein